METEESCRAWKEEYELEFPVIPDPDGALFRVFTNGWVPWSVLIGPDGKVVFSETEFDEAGFSAAIRQLYQQPAVVKPRARRAVASAGCTVVLGGGTGGLVAARELQRRIPAGHRVVPFGPTDVAEPVRVFVLDHSGADQLRAVLAEPAKRLVDVVHSEHDA